MKQNKNERLLWQEEIQQNKKICLFLMSLLEEYMHQSQKVSEDENSEMPEIFSCLGMPKENVVALYIKLSQQHLKLLDSEMKLAEKFNLAQPMDSPVLDARHWSPADLRAIEKAVKGLKEKSKKAEYED